MPLALSVQMCIIESRRVWHERRQISPTTTTTTGPTTTTPTTTTPTLQPSIFFYVKKSPRIELPKYLSHPYSCCCCCCCCTSDYKRAENYLDFIEKNELSLCACLELNMVGVGLLIFPQESFFIVPEVNLHIRFICQKATCAKAQQPNKCLTKRSIHTCVFALERYKYITYLSSRALVTRKYSLTS